MKRAQQVKGRCKLWWRAGGGERTVRVSEEIQNYIKFFYGEYCLANWTGIEA